MDVIFLHYSDFNLRIIIQSDVRVRSSEPASYQFFYPVHLRLCLPVPKRLDRMGVKHLATEISAMYFDKMKLTLLQNISRYHFVIC